jgi:hypothetical protein
MNDCCKDEQNLGEEEQVRDDLVVRRCKKCGASHYKLTLDAGLLVGEGAEL